MAPRHSPDFTLAPAARRLRLQTLIRLRWLAIVGQSVAVIVVALVLGFRLPLHSAAAVIGASAVLNILLALRFRPSQGLDVPRAAVLLGFDVLQLAALLYLTGGLQNPFVVLFLAPVLISATTLPPVPTTLIGALVVFCASALALFHLPMPWQAGETLRLPLLYLTGVWAAIVLAVGFIGVYAWRVAEEARQQSEALAATELVLQREQHLSALDGLAAAAAHELGTPLATIALIVKEIANAPDLAPAFAEDIQILRQQVDRCRDILKTLTSLDEEGAPHERMTLAHLLEEVAAPHRNFGIAIAVTTSGPDGRPEPVVRRNPGLLYGLGNLVENAVDFARNAVKVEARWDADTVEVKVRDDGPGFPSEVLMHLGEPYVTSRPTRQVERDAESGLGLGVFIAKTLLERSGAAVDFANAPASGAEITVRWPRAALDAGAA
ncbi:MAG TPA: ActS/PrrB/RegB family redox-sensitive histidine kinase [Hyphomicrobiales bacterium]|nr:ActS/PrrB/RegB family redox-sensitive histidine kinase [Hyphomicrobiales bacterium]